MSKVSCTTVEVGQSLHSFNSSRAPLRCDNGRLAPFRDKYRIRGNFRGMKFSLYSKQTGFSRFYFRGPHIPSIGFADRFSRFSRCTSLACPNSFFAQGCYCYAKSDTRPARNRVWPRCTMLLNGCKRPPRLKKQRANARYCSRNAANSGTLLLKSECMRGDIVSGLA